MRSRRPSGTGDEDGSDPAPLDGGGSDADISGPSTTSQKLGRRSTSSTSTSERLLSPHNCSTSSSSSPSNNLSVTTSSASARGRSIDRERLSPRSTSSSNPWNATARSPSHDRDTASPPPSRPSSSCSTSAKLKTSPGSPGKKAVKEPILEKMEDLQLQPRLYRRGRIRSPWAVSMSTMSVLLVTLFAVWWIVDSFTNRQCDSKGCIMPYMMPSYAPLRDFDTEHTPFASKYKLYLYREQHYDTSLEPKGVPVLFIPGNAGSYKQVRPMAAEAARQFYEWYKEDESILQQGYRSLDFFTVDFNEDITAFHGQTLLDQADYLNDAVTYILSLYHDARKSTMDADVPDPSSVIIFGHSMGGIVARTMLTRPNYQSNTINTIITLSAPHARAPVSFDKQIVDTYTDINNYWRTAYSAEWANQNPLWHVTLISIAGGGLDTVVPSDYASVASLVPETHGFTVFTSSIPKVWLGVDHLAILWCDQLRKVVAKSMLEVVDVRRMGQTKSRADRMRLFKKRYLTGMEPVAEKSLSSNDPTTLLTLDDSSHTIISLHQRMVLKSLGATGTSHSYLMPIPPTPAAGGTRFTLLTNYDLKAPNAKLEVLFCSVFPLQGGQAAAVLSMKGVGDSTGSTRLACKSAADDVILLPASTKTSKHAFDQKQPFSYLQFDLEELSEHQFVAVVDKAENPVRKWVVAEFADNNTSKQKSDITLTGLLVNGFKAQLLPDRPFVQEIHLPVLHSSLLAYKLTVGSQACGEDGQLFPPLLRQYLAEPYESKYFVNVQTADINLHGSAPFMPPPLRRPTTQGLNLQFWTDPTCNSTIEVTLKFDFVGSLGRLVMRYRTVFAAFPLFVVALVMRKQFRAYDAGNAFISFSEGLELVVTESLPFILGIFSLAGLVLAIQAKNDSSLIPTPFTKGLGNTSPSKPSTSIPPPPNYTKNDLLIGLQDPFFWFLGPLFAILAVGTCIILNYLTLIAIHLLTGIYSWFANRPVWISNSDRRRQSQSPAFTSNSPKRRIITTFILLLCVATFIPFQFAFMVACIVQISTCIRSLKFARECGFSSTAGSHWDFYHYTHSVLILMLWILPINLPVLVVWIHNLAVHWLTPFSSHHNVLSVMPIILLVETATTGSMIPRVENRFRTVTSTLFILLATFSALYGVTYAYLLHQLVNSLAAWLVAVHFSEGKWRWEVIREIWEEREEEVKKRP